MSFNVGVVGCGRWGAKHLETLISLKRQGIVNEIYACDINPNRLENLPPEITGVYSNWAEMHHSNVLDLVSVVTPNSTHISLGIAMLQQGLNVLVEKPLGASFNDVKVLCDIAKKSKGTLYSGYLLRFHPGIELAKELIQNQYIGRVKSIRYTKYSSHEKPANANVIENLASHAFSTIPHLINSKNIPLFPVAVTLVDSKPAPLEKAPQAKFHMAYPGQGILSQLDVEVHVGWGKTDRNQLTIEGMKQNLRLDFRQHGSIESGSTQTGYREIITHHSTPPLEAQYKHIILSSAPTEEILHDHIQTATLLAKATSLAQKWHNNNV